MFGMRVMVAYCNTIAWLDPDPGFGDQVISQRSDQDPVISRSSDLVYLNPDVQL